MLRGQQRRQRPTRRNDEAQPQFREHAFGKGADVKYRFVPVQGLQGVRGFPIERELGLIIVFKDERAPGRREGDQFPAPFRRHGISQRELVRRRDEDQVDLFRELRDDKSFGIDRDRHDLGAGHFEGAAGKNISGLFNGYRRFSRCNQEAAEQVDRLLRPARDDDVSRVAGDRARQRQVVCDRLPQAFAALRFHIGPFAEQVVARGPCVKPAPYIAGEDAGIGHAREKIENHAFPGNVLFLDTLPVCSDMAPVMPLADGRASRPPLLSVVRHEKAQALPRRHIPLDHQAIKDIDHSVAGNADFAGELPRGRQTHADRQATLQNGLHQQVIQGMGKPPRRRVSKVEQDLTQWFHNLLYWWIF